jgi:transposase
VEATTGWRYVVEELQRAGLEPHLAEPAETRSLQGRKKRAKSDRLDAGHLRDLLVIDRLPESWIPPDHIQQIRTLMRLRHSLIEEQLRSYARSQAGCQALMEHYGVGELTSVALLSELGDTRRFSSSKKAVRYAGMDITVHSSDDRRAAGKLSRQGPPVLRWAAFEVSAPPPKRLFRRRHSPYNMGGGKRR